jgi:hypothetical protein
MFSYKNKIVAVSLSSASGEADDYDITINDAFVGSLIAGERNVFIASENTGINIVSTSGTGYPSSVLWRLSESYYVEEYQTGSASNLGSPLSGYFTGLGSDFGGEYTLTHTGSGASWVLSRLGGPDLDLGGTDPFSPYGEYSGEGTSTVTVTPVGGAYPSDETYHFSNLLLNEGQNELCLLSTLATASGESEVYYNISSYDLSGSYLVNPSAISAGISYIPSGTDQCLYFDLEYPTGGSIPLVEVSPVFNVDTGNLNQVFTGSGVHLRGDVTFFFDILDQQLNTISSNQQFLENPLIGGCVFDILNADGTTAVENFSTGKNSRSLTLSALDNENIFGSYRKDFGVRCKLPNTFDGSIFTGEFYAYGNVPNILDIVPDYSEFSGAAQATELVNASIVLQNDLNFTQMDRYDVYALTGSGSAVDELTFLNPFQREGYLFSQNASNVINARSLTINRGALTQNIPYYFTVVPYGALGSGNSFVFGPATFVTVENVVVFPETNSSALNLYDGDSFAQAVYKTGRFLSDTGILHEFSSGQFSSVKYFIEISGSGERRLSELRGVINTTGLDLTKQPVNDTFTQYQLTGFASGQCGLFASGSGYTDHVYKLQATMI